MNDANRAPEKLVLSQRQYQSYSFGAKSWNHGNIPSMKECIANFNYTLGIDPFLAAAINGCPQDNAKAIYHYK